MAQIKFKGRATDVMNKIINDVFDDVCIEVCKYHEKYDELCAKKKEDEADEYLDKHCPECPLVKRW